MLAVALHVVFTPTTPHVAASAQEVHGAFPVMENAVPAAHATWHTVSDVFVQAVLTPAAQEESTAQVLHGEVPDAENVVPATHVSALSQDALHCKRTEETWKQKKSVRACRKIELYDELRKGL